MRKEGSRQIKARPTDASARVIPCKAASVSGLNARSEAAKGLTVEMGLTIALPAGIFDLRFHLRV